MIHFQFLICLTFSTVSDWRFQLQLAGGGGEQRIFASVKHPIAMQYPCESPSIYLSMSSIYTLHLANNDEEHTAGCNRLSGGSYSFLVCQTTSDVFRDPCLRFRNFLCQSLFSSKVLILCHIVWSNALFGTTFNHP